MRALVACRWLPLATLSCSFPEYSLSIDPGTSNGGLAAGGTESVAGMTGHATAGMGGAASGGAPGGAAGVGGAPQEPSPAGGSGGAGAGGMAGASNQTGGSPGIAGGGGSGGGGGAVTRKACADFDDLPSDCLCRDHSGHAYLFCSNPYPWSQGTSRCGFYQMSLAKIESPGENSWILKQAHDISDPRPLTFFWIGASSVDSPGTWHWPDGTPFWRGDASGNQVSGSYFNWRSFSPQNTNGAACVFMDLNGWEEGDCSIKRGYVCEAQ